jgi:hypothetical protein
VTIHHVDVQHARAAALDSFDLVSETRKVSGENRRRDIDGSVHEAYGFGLGVGRGVTGRLLSLLAAGRVFVFGKVVRFTLLRGVAFTLGTPAFAFGRLTLAGLFVLPFAFALAFSFAFLFLGGRFGLFAFSFTDEFVLRFSAGSSGVTFSGDSPAFVGRLMSIATVWPVLTTSPARGS